ncbi:hypothetical protein K491DRAFT_679937 [Lophiostoma macrostomum CBS 122681]|uniref:BTB domain-containing protein n=1 Tax=Lophiostoma macrostomum CBS 122681 TaxID=1314788 RepID=A0A6A6T4N3_9PLEO|nr:hypothetical protein K491DRAFT_679937 [Lophiostoma macrostomum CBS 122681]
MVLSFQELVCSPQFTFICGDDEEPVVVHEAALASLSPPLDRLMKGPMREASEKMAMLPYVEKDDFLRLCEYAYRGQYTIPDAVPSATSVKRPLALGEADLEVLIAEIEKADEEEREREKQYERQYEKQNLAGMTAEQRMRETKHLDGQLPLARRFVERQYIFGTPMRTEIMEGYKAKRNKHMTEDFTPIFLVHAKIYTLAGFFMIKDLEELALENLRATLKTFRIHSTRIGDVINLVRYTYESTPDRDGENEDVNALRQLVLEYVALNYTRIDTAEFRQLLEEGGQFVSDIWKLMRQEGLMVSPKKL